MASDLQIGQGHTPDAGQQRKQRARALLADFEAVSDSIIGDYEGLTGPQRQAIATALTNWNKAPGNLAEATTNLNAAYALCGLLVSLVDLLIQERLG